MNTQASNVLPPPMPDLEMKGAKDDFLDVSGPNPEASVISKPWAKPNVWLQVLGVDHSNQEHIIGLHESSPATPEQQADGLNTPIPREKLLEFANKSKIHIEGNIAFDGDTSEAAAEKFPSLELTLINAKDKHYDLVDFDDQTYGGWTTGPGGAEFQFVLNAPGDYVLFNNTSTPGDQHKGIVLHKTFPTVPGETYEISVDVKKDNPGTPDAMLFFSIDNNNSPIHAISSLNWTNLKFSATATSNSTAGALNNDQHLTNGNDFSINNLLIKSLP
ncbi:carbohydrate binding domain-containing protein [Pseudomonas sp. GB2N2]